MEHRLETMQQTLGSLTEQLENSKEQLGTPFPHACLLLRKYGMYEEELAVKKKRLAELTAILESAAADDNAMSVSPQNNKIIEKPLPVWKRFNGLSDLSIIRLINE